MALDTRLPLYKFQVDPVQFDILSPILKGQEIKSNRLKQNAYLKDLNEKEKIKSIIKAAKNESGELDFNKAAKNLANAGLISEADNLRKYSVQSSRDEGLRAFNRLLKEGKDQGTETEMVPNPDFDPNLRNSLSSLDQLKQNPYVASPDFLKQVPQDDAYGPKTSPAFQIDLENLSTNQKKAVGENPPFDPLGVNIKGEGDSLGKMNSLADLYANRNPEFITKVIKKPNKPHSYQESVDLYLKTVPFTDEESASKFLKLLEPEKDSETERKEKIVDQAWNFAFSIPENKSAYTQAMDFASKGDMGSARNLLVANLNKTELPGSIKGLLVDRVMKNFPVTPDSPEVASAKALATYQALSGPKLQNEIDLAKAKEDITREKEAAKDLKARAEKYGEDRAKTNESDTRIKTIKGLVDKGVYSKMATIETSKWPTLFRLPAEGLIAYGLSQDEVNLRNNVIGFRNALLKERSGGAVTDPEQLRLINELESNLLSTPEQFKQAIDNMYELSRLREENRIGSYGQDAIELYNTRKAAPKPPAKVRKKFNPATGELE